MKGLIFSLILLFGTMTYASDSILDINVQHFPKINTESVIFSIDDNKSDQILIKHEPLFKFLKDDIKIENIEPPTQTWATPEDIQRNLAQEHDKKLLEYSILSNKFYENEQVRIFNYSAYNVQQLKNSLINPAVANGTSNEFYISFGYGVEFKINQYNRIGYEYLSSFPYDRGQIIRIFFVRNLKY